jgi:glycerol-3-phosphate O-acyltransferase 3/4
LDYCGCFYLIFFCSVSSKSSKLIPMSQRGQALGRPSKEPGWKDPLINTDSPTSSTSSSSSSSSVPAQPSPQSSTSSLPQSLQNSPNLSAVNSISAAASAAAAAAAATIARATNTVTSSSSSSPGDSQRKISGSEKTNMITSSNNSSSSSTSGLGSLLGARDSYQDLVAMERERELIRKLQRDARGGGASGILNTSIGGSSLRSRNQSDISVGDSTMSNHQIGISNQYSVLPTSGSIGSSSGTHSVRDSLRDSGIGLVLASSGDYTHKGVGGGGGNLGNFGGRSSDSSSSNESNLSTPVDVIAAGLLNGGTPRHTPSDSDSSRGSQSSRTIPPIAITSHSHTQNGTYNFKTTTSTTSSTNMSMNSNTNVTTTMQNNNINAPTDIEYATSSNSGNLSQTPPSSMVGVPSFFDVALPLIRQGYTAMVDDSFTRCFKSKKIVYWNWNIYLFVAWILGVIVRYGILLPVRMAAFLCGFLIFFLTFPLVHLFKFALGEAREQHLKVLLIQFLASAFVASWHGVVRFHGIRPGSNTSGGGKHRQGIFVANHSSMIDFIILLQSHPYAVVGQKHLGWVGFMQDKVLSALHCVWFNRGESEDKKTTAERMVKHIRDPSNARFPLLLFPEGTCVNNEYVIQFKKFVFELGVPIFPVAIKYNKVFVDAYWNSREQSFHYHLFRLMRSWAVVVDIWFLDPQMIRPGESGADFAMRVQHLIAARANLKPVAWDGYMKHYMPPPPRFIKVRQEAVAEELCYVTGVRDEGVALAAAAAEAVTLTARAAQHATVAAAKAAIEADVSPIAQVPTSTVALPPISSSTNAATSTTTTTISSMPLPWSSAFKAIGGGLMGTTSPPPPPPPSAPASASASAPASTSTNVSEEVTTKPTVLASAPESTLSPVSISESDGGGGGNGSQLFTSTSDAVIPPILVPSLSPSVPIDETKLSNMSSTASALITSKRPPISPSNNAISNRKNNTSSPSGRGGGSKQRDRVSSSPTPRAGTSSSVINGPINSPLVHLLSPPSPLMLKEESPP